MEASTSLKNGLDGVMVDSPAKAEDYQCFFHETKKSDPSSIFLDSPLRKDFVLSSEIEAKQYILPLKALCVCTKETYKGE